MNQVSMFRELYAYDDWATSRVLDAAAPLNDEQRDRPFDMGFKSLRATLVHTYGAKLVWLHRIADGLAAKWENVPDDQTLDRTRTNAAILSERYGAILASLDDAGLERMLDYRDMRGNQHKSRLLDVLLHVANHGVHHRSQALNMLRHLGAKPPRIDFIFRHFESPDVRPRVLSIDVIRYYFKCTDWARNVALDACARLTDEQLDRSFEMGIGSIRTAFSHTEDAERWWLKNWRGESPGAFPKPNKTDTIATIRSRFDETATGRNAFVALLKSDADLLRSVEAKPAPDRTIVFPIGVTMLQLCTHGTHHRAQIFNMLKRVGATVPGSDLILMTRPR